MLLIVFSSVFSWVLKLAVFHMPGMLFRTSICKQLGLERKKENIPFNSFKTYIHLFLRFLPICSLCLSTFSFLFLYNTIYAWPSQSFLFFSFSLCHSFACSQLVGFQVTATESSKFIAVFFPIDPLGSRN
ncbi:hypothetical protein ES288_D02G213800v1 [Gossypium darwinii]|uniref:Uncharacterized protein n=1 Tax=Gossypium darwinii TaxID=34276 RepID=A0A5D2DGC9_GOSDA|nr:hypothetical protein ES288_D02G213800v1 [Gossypium darwinii]